MTLTNLKRTVAIAVTFGALTAGVAHAQAPAPSAASTPGATGRDQSPVAQPVTAAERLTAAAKILAGIQDRDLKPEAKDLLSQVKSHFAEMVTLNGPGETKTDDQVIERPIPATAPVGTSGTKSDGEKNDWKDKFSEVERDLTEMIGGGPSTAHRRCEPTEGAGVRTYRRT